jgi:starch synthase
VSTYFDRKPQLEKMIRTAMAQDFSWDKSAERYEWAYEEAMIHKPK